MFPSFSGALLIAGGSGITFALGIAQDLIQKDLDGNSRVKTIEIVWAIQDPRMSPSQSCINHSSVLTVFDSFNHPSSASSPRTSLVSDLCISPYLRVLYTGSVIR